jgi:DNA replication protein
MILKRLFEDDVLNIERLILREYRRLELSVPETHVLLSLFSISRKRKTFSLAAISRRIDYDQEMIGTIIESLYKKNLLTLALEKTKDGKSREIFDLDPVFQRLQSLFQGDLEEQQKAIFDGQISQTLELFEQGLGRLLRPHEIEEVRRWYDDGVYSHERILKAIEQSEPRISVKAVERFLTAMIPETVEIDDEVENILDSFYRKIR